MTDVKIGTTWRGSNHVVFVVQDVQHHADGTWVHYRSQALNQPYSCLIEAFCSRFTQQAG